MRRVQSHDQAPGLANGHAVDQLDQADAAPSPAFDAIERAAAELEAPAGVDQAGAPGQAPAIDNAAELAGALDLARMIVAPMFAWWPEFGRVWSDQTLQGIAKNGAAVMDLHGWTMGGIMGKYGPYIALAMATAPPCFVTLQAIKAKKAEHQAQAEAGQAEPIVATGPDSPPNQ